MSHAVKWKRQGFAFEVIRDRDKQVCSKKRRYRNKQIAKNAAAMTARSGGKSVIYECPVCYQWHVTSVDQSIERARRRGL